MSYTDTKILWDSLLELGKTPQDLAELQNLDGMLEHGDITKLEYQTTKSKFEQMLAFESQYGAKFDDLMKRSRAELFRAVCMWPPMSSDGDGRETIREEIDEFMVESRRSHKDQSNIPDEITELVQSIAMLARYGIERRGDHLK